MKNSTLKTVDHLLEPKKMLSIGILCLIAFLVLYFIWKKIKQTTGDIVTTIKDNAQLNQYQEQSGEKLSYTEAEYVSMANSLYSAMKGWGTNEETINAVFNRIKNTADLYKLINVFGTRDGENLYEWIDGEYIGEPTDINNILASKGINVRFA